MSRSGPVAGIAFVAAVIGAAALAADLPLPTRLLVLTDGRTLTGQIVPHAAGYLVERPSGSVLIPTEQVRCVADDLPDAYRQQRDTMVDASAANLIALAEWCYSYRLYEEARLESRRALRRDPTSEAARKLLTRLDAALERTTGQTRPTTPIINSDGYVVQDVDALGGLSRKTASQFTMQIQPLLINKCGGLACHGSSGTNTFRLETVRLNGNHNRQSVERNLAAVLKLIDTQTPLRSPLLLKPQGAHGGRSEAIFGGAGGATQQQLLKDWAKRVGEELHADEEVAAAQPTLRPARTPVASSIETASLVEEVTSPGESLPVLVVPPRPSKPVTADPFDPEVFNRQFGGKKPR